MRGHQSGLRTAAQFRPPPAHVTTSRAGAVYTYQGALLSIHDGDTITMRLDLGHRIWHDVTVRLAGLDAPELRTPEGDAAKIWVTTWFATYHGPYIVHTIKDRSDKYGRLLATVVAEDGHSLTADLLADGIARVYNGGKR